MSSLAINRLFILALALTFVICGCGPKDYYIKAETGPHGVTTSRKVYYTPEQLAEQRKAHEAYYPPARPADPSLAEVEDAWPKLSAEQREAIMKTVRQTGTAK